MPHKTPQKSTRAQKRLREAYGRSDTAPAESVLLTIPEVARRLRISATRAYALAAAGGISSVHLRGRRVQVPAAALAAWLDVLTEAALANADVSRDHDVAHTETLRSKPQ